MAGRQIGDDTRWVTRAGSRAQSAAPTGSTGTLHVSCPPRALASPSRRILRWPTRSTVGGRCSSRELLRPRWCMISRSTVRDCSPTSTSAGSVRWASWRTTTGWTRCWIPTRWAPPRRRPADRDVSDSAAFDGSSYVADTSAWARSVRRAAADEWSQAMLAGQLWMTPVVKLELLYSTRDEAEFAQLEGRLDDLREAQLDRSVVRARWPPCANWRRLGRCIIACRSRMRWIAAAAAERGVGVLHYDEHFDRLAAVLGFESRWIVARGRD